MSVMGSHKYVTGFSNLVSPSPTNLRSAVNQNVKISSSTKLVSRVSIDKPLFSIHLENPPRYGLFQRKGYSVSKRLQSEYDPNIKHAISPIRYNPKEDRYLKLKARLDKQLSRKQTKDTENTDGSGSVSTRHTKPKLRSIGSGPIGTSFVERVRASILETRRRPKR